MKCTHIISLIFGSVISLVTLAYAQVPAEPLTITSQNESSPLSETEGSYQPSRTLTKRLEALKERFEAYRHQKVEVPLKEQSDKLNEQALRALEKQTEKLVKTGDLERLIILTKTIEDLKGGQSLEQADDKTAEGLGDLYVTYRTAHEKIRRTFYSAELDALRKYDLGLKSLQSDLTLDQEFDAALHVKTLREASQAKIKRFIAEPEAVFSEDQVPELLNGTAGEIKVILRRLSTLNKIPNGDFKNGKSMWKADNGNLTLISEKAESPLRGLVVNLERGLKNRAYEITSEDFSLPKGSYKSYIIHKKNLGPWDSFYLKGESGTTEFTLKKQSDLGGGWLVTEFDLDLKEASRNRLKFRAHDGSNLLFDGFILVRRS